MKELRIYNQTELNSIIEIELKAYNSRLEGHATDYSQPANARGDFPRKLFKGAIVQLCNRTLNGALGELSEHLAEGYTLFLHNILSASCINGTTTTLYVRKPEAVVAVDVELITKELTEQYYQEIDSYNKTILAEQARKERNELELEADRRLAQKHKDERDLMIALIEQEASKPRKSASK
jgi:hypothetical protein